MKKLLISLPVALLLVVGIAMTVDQDDQKLAADRFEKLKALQGDWHAKGPDGSPMQASYKVVSGGATLREQISFHDRVTMYHLDGDQLMLTHDCVGKTQPRCARSPRRPTATRSTSGSRTSPTSSTRPAPTWRT